jgi:hypothetical protein
MHILEALLYTEDQIQSTQPPFKSCRLLEDKWLAERWIGVLLRSHCFISGSTVTAATQTLILLCLSLLWWTGAVWGGGGQGWSQSTSLGEGDAGSDSFQPPLPPPPPPPVGRLPSSFKIFRPLRKKLYFISLKAYPKWDNFGPILVPKCLIIIHT